MAADAPIVYVVDDEDSVRLGLQRLCESVGLKTAPFDSAERFLEAYSPATAGCLILDVRMPGMSGLELQQELLRRGFSVPIVMISAYGDVPMVVAAMKLGAVDFLEKPIRPQALLEAVNHAIAKDAQRRRRDAACATGRALLERLTAREWDVLKRLYAGDTVEQIAHRLGLSAKTIYVHRQHILEKLETDSLVTLGRSLVLALDAHEQAADLPRDRPASAT